MKMESAKECVLEDLNSREAINLLPVLVYLGIILVFGVVGNGLSLFIYSTKFRRSNSRGFFIFLSVSELISCVFIVPMEIFTLTHHFELEYGNLKCRALMFISIWQVHVSSTTLIVIAVDRWRKICHPFHWQISLKLSVVLLISLVAVGFVAALPSVSVYSSNPYTAVNVSDDASCTNGNGTDVRTDITIYKCSTNSELESIYPQLYVMFFWIMVLVGVGMLAFLYWDIKRAVKRQEQKFGGVKAPASEKRKRFVLQDSVEVENFEHNSKLGKDKPDSITNISEKGEQLDSTKEYEDENGDDDYEFPKENKKSSDLHLGSNIQHATDELSSVSNSSQHGDNCNDEYDEKEINAYTGKKVRHLNVNTQSKSTAQAAQVCLSGDHDDANTGFVAECHETNDNADVRKRPVTVKTFRCVVQSLGNRMVCSVLSKKKGEQRDARSRNVTFIMFVVTVSSVLGFLPYLTLSSMRALYHDWEQNMSTSQYVTYHVFLRSYFLKAVTNPIVYGLLDPRFRASVKSLCSRTNRDNTATS